jgi:hypothetical protein
MKLGKLIVYIFFMLVVMNSCKKINIQPIETECKLTLIGKKDSLNSGNIYFYYDNQNKLVGHVFYDVYNLSVINFPTPRFDSIVYNLDKSITIYHYECVFSEIKPNVTPFHEDYKSKTNITFGDNGISKMVTTNNQFGNVISEKNFIYESGKLKNIKEISTRNLAEFVFNATAFNLEVQTDYSIIYEGNNVKSIISTLKKLDNTPIGGDTIIYKSFSSLKNPYKPLNFIWNYYFHGISENVFTEFTHSFTYYNYNKSTSLVSGGGNMGRIPWSSLQYTDNGKGYPKEFMEYKCD